MSQPSWFESLSESQQRACERMMTESDIAFKQLEAAPWKLELILDRYVPGKGRILAQALRESRTDSLVTERRESANGNGSPSRMDSVRMINFGLDNVMGGADVY